MAPEALDLGLLGVEGFGHIRGIGTSGDEMLGDASALFRCKRGDGCEDAAEGDGDIVNVVHEADGFSGERHGRLVLVRLAVRNGLCPRNQGCLDPLYLAGVLIGAELVVPCRTECTLLARL